MKRVLFLLSKWAKLFFSFFSRLRIKPIEKLPARPKRPLLVLTTFELINAFLYSNSQEPGQSFLIDCGMGPFEEEDSVRGDIYSEKQKLNRQWSTIKAVIISHGHLDHWNLLYDKPRGIPVYCTPLVRKLIEYQSSFDQRLVSLLRDVCVFLPGQSFSFDKSLPIDSFSVPHSIPEAVGFRFVLAGKKIVHLGEFKFQGPNPKEKLKLEACLRVFGKEGVDLLLLDVQNIETPGFTLSEKEVKENLHDLIFQTQDRVIVTCFASNLERIGGLVEIACSLKKPIVFEGASMEKAIVVGDMVDKIRQSFSFLLVNQPLILIAGSQAEEGSALWRQAYYSFPFLRRGDTLIFSSRSIPGPNEERLKEVIQKFQAQGINIILNFGESQRLGLIGPREALVHVSGHPAREDVMLALSLLEPKHLISRPPFVKKDKVWFLAKKVNSRIRVLGENEIVL